MNKALNLLAALVLGGVVMATTAMAGTVTLTLYSASGSPSYNGDDVYPYMVQVNNAAATPMMCDDATTDINVGDSWQANAYSMTQPNYANFKFSTAGLTTYEEAAVILTEVSDGSLAATDPNALADGNAAVWSLFDPDYSIATDNAEVTSILASAQAAVAAGGLDYSGVTVYTPAAGYSSQEFLSGDVTPTPEPATYALFGGGLLGLGFAGRKRLSAQR
jgi:hypothetical protein